MDDPIELLRPTVSPLGSDVICLLRVGAVGHQNVVTLDGPEGMLEIRVNITMSVRCDHPIGICVLFRPLTTRVMPETLGMGATVILEANFQAHPIVVGDCILIPWQMLRIRALIGETTLIHHSRAPTVALGYLRGKALRGLQTMSHLQPR